MALFARAYSVATNSGWNKHQIYKIKRKTRVFCLDKKIDSGTMVESWHVLTKKDIVTCTGVVSDSVFLARGERRPALRQVES